MNKFIREYSSKGFTETLEYNGKTYVKRYELDDTGYRGLDVDWEFEESLPDHLVEAINFGDELDIMEELNLCGEFENDDYEEED